MQPGHPSTALPAIELFPNVTMIPPVLMVIPLPTLRSIWFPLISMPVVPALPVLPARMPLPPLCEIWLFHAKILTALAAAASPKIPLLVLLANTQLRAVTSEPERA